jgi:iron complex outermembrane receptor protein
MATANPVSLLKQTKLYNDINSRITNIKLEYMLHFLPDLHIVFNYGNDYYKQNIKEDVDSTAAWTYSMAKGLYQRTNYTSENKIYDVNLIYSHKIKPLKSSIDFIAGYTYQNTKINYNNYERNTAYPLLVFDSSYASLENKYDAIFGRLIYNLKNKYSLSLSLRNDGFSKLFDGHNGSIFLPVNNLLFNDPNRNVFTPAAAIAWEISKEPFMKNIPFVSDLKLKTEYGKTGAWQQKDSKNLMHEEISTFSIGMDFGFFKNKITGSANYYNQVNDKLFAIITLFGGENYTANFGKIKNTGFELVLNTKIISSKNWKWNVSCNGAYNKNEVKTDNEYDYYGNETGTIVGYYGNKIMIYSSGDPLNTFFVLQQRYIDGKPMEGMYVDRSGEGGNIAGNIDNYYKYKSSNPKIIIGFASDVTYKNWNFSFSARANIGNYVYNNISSNSAYGIIYESNYLQNIDKSVTESGFLYPQFFSDYYVENASFLRMDYIRLNYHFDKIWNHKVALDVFTTVQNAFVITKYKGLDPEVSDGIDYYSCPRARIFSLGCSLHLL